MKKINRGLIFAALFIAAIATGATAFYALILTGIKLLYIFAPAGILLISLALSSLFLGAIITFKKLSDG